MSTWNVSSEATLYSGNWAINASRGALLAGAVIFGLLDRLPAVFNLTDTGGYKKLKDFDPTGGRIS